ncbi:MAG: hypothetical protein RIG84_16650 [Roseovarius sp.]
MKAIGTVGAAGALAFLAGQAVAGEPVTEAMFLDTHVGNCVAYAGPSSGRQCYAADGTTTYEDQSYGTDSGTWEYRDGQVCVKWSREVAESCNAYLREPDGTFSAATGYAWAVEG